MTKKIIALMLAVIMTLSLFCGCKKGGNGENGPYKLKATPNGEKIALVVGSMRDWLNNRTEKAQSEPYADGSDCFHPQSVKIKWNADPEAQYYMLYIATNKDLKDAQTYITFGTEIEVKDLFSGYKYYYKVVIAHENEKVDSDLFSFETEQLPRTIMIDSVSNTRDIGGYYTTDGKQRVKQGMVYRGANVDTISTQGREDFLVRYGIKTELDLRTGNDKSPFDKDITVKHILAPYYVGTNGVNGKAYKKGLAEEIRTFADPEAYPVYFHCAIGRDRTGTLAALLLALLGVSEDDIFIDYEASRFSVSGLTDNAPANIICTNMTNLLDYIKNYKGADLKESTETFCKDYLGITDDEITAIRTNLLEEAKK